MTILNFICWPETMVAGRNTFATPNEQDIVQKLNIAQHIDDAYQPFGDRYSAIKIVEALENMVEELTDK